MQPHYTKYIVGIIHHTNNFSKKSSANIVECQNNRIPSGTVVSNIHIGAYVDVGLWNYLTDWFRNMNGKLDGTVGPHASFMPVPRYYWTMLKNIPWMQNKPLTTYVLSSFVFSMIMSYFLLSLRRRFSWWLCFGGIHFYVKFWFIDTVLVWPNIKTIKINKYW